MEVVVMWTCKTLDYFQAQAREGAEGEHSRSIWVLLWHLLWVQRLWWDIKNLESRTIETQGSPTIATRLWTLEPRHSRLENPPWSPLTQTVTSGATISLQQSFYFQNLFLFFAQRIIREKETETIEKFDTISTFQMGGSCLWRSPRKIDRLSFRLETAQYHWRQAL